MRRLLLTALLTLPAAGYAAGMDSTPPTQTNTTAQCQNGQVWSEQDKACVDAQESRLDDDTLYGAVREFAYAGMYDEARGALAAMSDPTDDRVLTYMGFVHRKQGDVDLGNAYYRQAIARNPDNYLARSYMGQGFVETGEIAAARAQLTEIRTRGGRGTWAEISLRMAIENGRGYSY